MKIKISCLLVLSWIATGCDPTPTATLATDQKPESSTDILEDGYGTLHFQNIFVQSDAENILGEPAHLTDSSSNSDAKAVVYQSTYKALAEDSASGKTGGIYLMFEHYADQSGAAKLYSGIKEANKNHGIKVIPDLGDEAYFHTDNENFYFILIRKGSRIIRMKVNKITSHTSLPAFHLVAKNMTAGL